MSNKFKKLFITIVDILKQKAYFQIRLKNMNMSFL